MYPAGYTCRANRIAETAAFTAWLAALADAIAKAAILRRIDQARQGNFGDHKPLEHGLNEMRIDVGPGYRVYYCRIGKVEYLLIGGRGKSTQKAISNAPRIC